MAFVVKSLGAGTVTVTGTADLYTVPAGKSAMVSNLRLVSGHNTLSTTLNLYVKPSGGSDLRAYQKDFTIAAKGKLVLPNGLTLAEGDKLRLGVSGVTSPEIGYLINGVEQE